LLFGETVTDTIYSFSISLFNSRRPEAFTHTGAFFGAPAVPSDSLNTLSRAVLGVHSALRAAKTVTDTKTAVTATKNRDDTIKTAADTPKR
jgi:hypothetical protein